MASSKTPKAVLGSQRIIRCPGCGGPSVYAATNPARPFCSERCRGTDLGAWATEGYRVPARSEPDDEGGGGRGTVPTL